MLQMAASVMARADAAVQKPGDMDPATDDASCTQPAARDHWPSLFSIETQSSTPWK
jgi:hypothetical protein